jgi:hypothetical protein
MESAMAKNFNRRCGPHNSGGPANAPDGPRVRALLDGGVDRWRRIRLRGGCGPQLRRVTHRAIHDEETASAGYASAHLPAMRRVNRISEFLMLRSAPRSHTSARNLEDHPATVAGGDRGAAVIAAPRSCAVERCSFRIQRQRSQRGLPIIAVEAVQHRLPPRAPRP